MILKFFNILITVVLILTIKFFEKIETIILICVLFLFYYIFFSIII